VDHFVVGEVVADQRVRCERGTEHEHRREEELPPTIVWRGLCRGGCHQGRIGERAWK
jgi:hypothetical protein